MGPGPLPRMERREGQGPRAPRAESWAQRSLLTQWDGLEERPRPTALCGGALAARWPGDNEA